jgi:hypothetical protein
MAKAPPFVAAKKGPKGAAAVGKTAKGNPFAAAKVPAKGKAPMGKKPPPFANSDV